MDIFKTHPLYRRHTLDTSMSSLWEFYKKKFIPLFIISFVVSLLTQIISSTLDLTKLQNTSDIQAMSEAMVEMIWPLAGIMAVSLLFNLIMSHYILYNPVDSSNVFTNLLKSIRYFIPYMAVIIFLMAAGSLLIGLGLVVFIIGAVFSIILVVTVYMFIAPVMLAENSDIPNTIKRIVSLTYKNFWTNIGWVSILIILIFMLSIGLSALILLPFTGDFIKTITSGADASTISGLAVNPFYILLSSAAGALTLPLMPVFSFIMYFNSIAQDEKAESHDNTEYNEGKVRVEDLYAKPYWEDDGSEENRSSEADNKQENNQNL